MRAGIYTLAASAVLGYASAGRNHHAHGEFHHMRRQTVEEAEEANATCLCTTTYMTYYGEPTCV
jgi:hypothetical protein